jgi:hypothetical protein
MASGIVYKATNTLTGVSYIGATKQTLKARRKCHLCLARKHKQTSMPFIRALRDYGPDAFEWCVLCEVPVEQLQDAEIQYIQEARDCGVSLYNMSAGPGRSCLPAHNKGKPKVLFQGKSYADWAIELGISYASVWWRIKTHGSPLGRGQCA